MELSSRPRVRTCAPRRPSSEPAVCSDAPIGAQRTPSCALRYSATTGTGGSCRTSRCLSSTRTTWWPRQGSSRRSTPQSPQSSSLTRSPPRRSRDMAAGEVHLDELLPEDLPRGSDLVKAGRDRGRLLEVPTSRYCRERGVRSEREYKAYARDNGIQTTFINVGYETWDETADVLNELAARGRAK